MNLSCLSVKRKREGRTLRIERRSWSIERRSWNIEFNVIQQHKVSSLRQHIGRLVKQVDMPEACSAELPAGNTDGDALALKLGDGE